MLYPICCSADNDRNLIPFVSFVNLWVLSTAFTLLPVYRGRGAYSVDCVPDPLADYVLLSWSLEAHKEMLYTALLLCRNLICENIHASINLHRIRVDYSGACISPVFVS